MLKIHRTRLSQGKLSRISWLGLAGTVSCCALVLVFGLMLFPALPQTTYAAPEPGTGGVTPSIGTSVGINLPASIDFDSVTPTPDGATTTATADLTVTATNSASYSLYLYSSDGDNSLRPKISANTSSIIATAGGVGLTLSSLKPNTWGYNLGTSAPDDNTTYSAVPTSNAEPIQTKDTSSTNSANDTYTLSFGTKVDTSIPSGTYTGALTVAVVAEPALVTIAFDGNGATGGSMSNQQIAAGQSANLNTNQYTRNGYDFTGWNTNAGGTGTSYTDGASYTAPAGSAGQTITLYAQWGFGKETLQGFTATDCQSQASSANVALTDIRDNSTYTVRYINGVCWMTQNLRIASGTTLTSADSNVVSDYTIPTTDLTAGDSYTEGRVHDAGNTTYGYWYNYCAATAGEICQASTGWNTSATQDICPRNWRLPTTTEAQAIAPQSDPDDENWPVADPTYVSVFNPVLGGLYSGGLLSGSNGFWWTNTANNSVPTQAMTFGYNGIGLYYNFQFGYSTQRSQGVYIRCIRSN